MINFNPVNECVWLFEKLYPHEDYDLYYDVLSSGRLGAIGLNIKSEKVTVLLDVDITIIESIKTLAHEYAHLLVGYNGNSKIDHDKLWKKQYEYLLDLFILFFKKRKKKTKTEALREIQYSLLLDRIYV